MSQATPSATDGEPTSRCGPNWWEKTIRAEQSAPTRTPTIRPLTVATTVFVFASQATWLTIGFVSSGFASWSAASGLPAPSAFVFQR